jgi:hypothetical protein
MWGAGGYRGARPSKRNNAVEAPFGSGSAPPNSPPPRTSSRQARRAKLSGLLWRREAAWLGAALYHERAGRKMINVLWPQRINRGPVATPAGHFFATYAP